MLYASTLLGFWSGHRSHCSVVTLVWRVADSFGKVVVLKNSWVSYAGECLAESKICEPIDGEQYNSWPLENLNALIQAESISQQVHRDSRARIIRLGHM